MPSYWPWVQAIRSYVRDCEPERLRSEMGTVVGDIAEIVPDVRERLPGLEPSPGLENLEQARVRLFDSITNFCGTGFKVAAAGSDSRQSTLGRPAVAAVVGIPGPRIHRRQDARCGHLPG